MRKCFFYIFDEPGAKDAILSLQKKGLIEVPIGWTDAAERNLSRKVIDNHELGKNTHAGHPIPVDGNHYHILAEFAEMFSLNSYRAKGLSPQEIWHIGQMCYDYFAGLLLEHDIDTVVFSSLPHNIGGILYRAARNLGIKTLICYQSIFSNRFFFFWDRDDFGYFESVEPISGNPGLQISEGHNVDVFWTKTEPTQVKHRSVWDMVILRYIWELWKRFAVDLLPIHQPAKRRKALARKHKRPLAGYLQVYHEHREFAKMHRKLALDQASYAERYVYFPLHMQPEATTSALGEPYFDQLLAIEQLAGILPREWKIYVKEHPCQGEVYRDSHQHRSTHFYERLMRLPQVVYLSANVSTYDLMRHSQFVSTISGSAGWEAVKGGKPVLTFGKAWYATLPGVFGFRPGMSLKEILACRINHAELEKKLNELLTKTAVGVADKDYNQSVEGYSHERNNACLEEFFRKVLL